MQSPLTRRPHPDTTGATHVGGWRLGALWLIWAATALGVAYAAIVSIPEFIRQLSYGGLLADRIHASGIAPSLFLRLELTADIILLTAWAAVATFIVFQRPDDWMALVVSILILTSGYFLGSLQFIVQWSHVQPHLSFLFRILGALDILIFGSGLVVYGAFPSGHFMPRRLIPVMVAIFGYIAVGDLINVLGAASRVPHSNQQNVPGACLGVAMPLLRLQLPVREPGGTDTDAGGNRRHVRLRLRVPSRREA